MLDKFKYLVYIPPRPFSVTPKKGLKNPIDRMKKTLFLAIVLCCVMSAMAGEYYVEDGNPVKVTLSGSDNIVKKGGGTLEATVNTDSKENQFTGNVDVQEGTMELKNPSLGSDNPPKGVIGASQKDGSGTGAIIKVAEGAELVMGEKTGINIPGGNLTNNEPQYTNLILGGENKFSKESHLSNVVVQETSIAATEGSSKKGIVVAEGISLTDHVSTNPINVVNVDAKVNEAHLTGYINVTNSTVECADVLWMMNFNGKDDMCLKVQNNSSVYLDDEGGIGILEDVSVDATSRVNVKDVIGAKAAKGEMARIYLLGENDLHVSATENGGLAEKSVSECTNPEHHHTAGDKGEIITYTSSQLSGCSLVDGESSIVVFLDDDLPNISDYKHFTFNLVMLGVDVSSAIDDKLSKELEQEGYEFEEGKHYFMGDNSPMSIILDENMQKAGITLNHLSIAHYNDYQGQGQATILTFSTDNIPEPATATLSLLALAGLCARRRR